MDIQTILLIVAVVVLVAYFWVRSRRKTRERKYRDM